MQKKPTEKAGSHERPTGIRHFDSPTIQVIPGW